MPKGGDAGYSGRISGPLSLPSHVSLLPSTYPFSNGVEDNGEILASNAITLATVLKSQGDSTAAFIGGFAVVRRSPQSSLWNVRSQHLHAGL